METIYRVQDINGRGPYQPGLSDKWIDPDNDGSRCPNIFEEFGRSPWRRALFGQSLGCGFKTREQLHAWFSETELQRMTKLGFSVVEMSVDTILAESKSQLIFARNRPLNVDYRTVWP